MELSYGQALEAQAAIPALLEREMAPRLGLRLRAVQRELAAALEAFDVERLARLREFCQTDADGKIATREDGTVLWKEPAGASIAGWGAVWEEMSAAKVEVLNSIPIAMLDALEAVPGRLIASLEPLVRDREDA